MEQKGNKDDRDVKEQLVSADLLENVEFPDCKETQELTVFQEPKEHKAIVEQLVLVGKKEAREILGQLEMLELREMLERLEPLANRVLLGKLALLGPQVKMGAQGAQDQWELEGKQELLVSKDKKELLDLRGLMENQEDQEPKEPLAMWVQKEPKARLAREVRMESLVLVEMMEW